MKRLSTKEAYSRTVKELYDTMPIGSLVIESLNLSRECVWRVVEHHPPGTLNIKYADGSCRPQIDDYVSLELVIRLSFGQNVLNNKFQESDSKRDSLKNYVPVDLVELCRFRSELDMVIQQYVKSGGI